MPSLLIGKNNLYYEIEGKGDPLVLIAGYGCDLCFWETIRKPLANHFQLIMLDNRGVGRSECPKESFTTQDMANDVLHLIEKLELKKPHILGHSMGSAIAQILAYHHPEKVNKTIFAQTFMKLAPASTAALRAFLTLYRDNVPMYKASQTVLPWLMSDEWLKSPELCELFLKIQSEQPFVPTIEGLTKQCEALTQFDSSSWYPKITTAPLILASSQDRLCPPQEAELMASNIPNAKCHVFQKIGHVAPLENPQEFCKVTLDFLSS